ncbi:MAG: hypothetical protein E7425_09835 [Ruminococcaceae bacterium]|nr:hypothetical protein [Oscillospiraceae bacterium]
MTAERKDELLTAALKLIGTHLDEDENIARALERYLGMTTEEMRECGIEAAGAPTQDVRACFEQKIRDCLSLHEEAWRNLMPAALVEQAEVIASYQFMARRTMQLAGEEEMAYLLRFKDPLEVLADYWNDRTGMSLTEDEEIGHVLWEIMDRQAAEADYEMEPEYYSSAYQEPQSPDLTM